MTKLDTAMSSRDANREVELGLSIAQEQLSHLIRNHPGKLPVFTVGGRWHFDKDAWAPEWTGGFLAGMIWIFAARTGDPWWRHEAERYSRLLESRKLDSGTHDIGFLFSPSWGRWHTLHPSESTRDVIIQAGRTMAARFNRAGRYLHSWVDRGSTSDESVMWGDYYFVEALDRLARHNHVLAMAT